MGKRHDCWFAYKQKPLPHAIQALLDPYCGDNLQVSTLARKEEPLSGGGNEFAQGAIDPKNCFPRTASTTSSIRPGLRVGGI